MGEKNSVEKLEVEEIMTDDGAKEPRIEDELQKETHQGFDLTPLQESPNSGSFSKGYGARGGKLLLPKEEEEPLPEEWPKGEGIGYEGGKKELR